ncbi:linear amide C-N hydrolase [Pseudonocardia sp. KRD-182]|uniref:linear amide C-N hydrolase n=1 Tax=Pseudonocardia oceani TaxID=2792013 RepID=UPI001C49CEAC|nr:linear amide C-N hydrolase [Pseudonocardia oceani]MBW0112441.1 linear amide C-N hydrolase [Pseudonocardia oceani]
MDTDLWAFAAASEHTGENGPNAFTCTSTHSTVIAAANDSSTTDGINDVGLVGNLLYPAESNFGEPGARPLLSVYHWTQYMLDTTCATVAEAVKAGWSAPFAITTPVLPNGRPCSLHLAMSAAGDAAVFKFGDGVLTVHHCREHRVTLSSSVYDAPVGVDRELRFEIGAPYYILGMEDEV